MQYIPFMKHVIHMNNGEIDFIETSQEAMRQDFYMEFINSENNEDSYEDNKKEIKEEKNNKISNEPKLNNNMLNELNDTDFKNMSKSKLLEIINIKSKKKNLKKTGETNNKDSSLPNFYSIKIIINWLHS